MSSLHGVTVKRATSARPLLSTRCPYWNVTDVPAGIWATGSSSAR